MPDPRQYDDGGVMWGVKHSQGIAWQDNEQRARERMRELVARDARSRVEARGKVRLVRRELGPIEVVENPYRAPLPITERIRDNIARGEAQVAAGETTPLEDIE